MTQIRQDFERMATLLPRDGSGRSEVPLKDAAGDPLPTIDRIVVYIDDLDRCPPHRVVEVLEAVHLLLAVRLFVVVVAVDPRWLLRSLTSHYQQLFAATTGQRDTTRDTTTELAVNLGEEELWASTPAQYLEKIFQIVLTLPPMERTGYQRMVDDLVGVRATPSENPADHPNTSDGTSVPSGPAGTTLLAHSPETPPEPPRLSLESLPIVERADPLALTADEHRLISLLGPPLITAPRAVKRLANSYGLLIATAAQGERGSGSRADLDPVPDIDPQQDAFPYRAAMVLLAAVIGYPMLGPSFFPDLHGTAQTAPTTSWADHLNGLRPHKPDRRWSNRIESTLTPERAQHWNALLDALTEVGRQAAAARLPLPQRLGIWARWVVPVGRLSFPTGNSVSRLTQATDTTFDLSSNVRYGGL
jgi:hypothetical protein